MNVDQNERAVRELLQPLRSIEPAVRRPRPEKHRRWWLQLGEAAVVAAAVVVLVGVIALLAHRSPKQVPAQQPHFKGITYVWHGGVANGSPDPEGQVRTILHAGRGIVGFDWSPDGRKIAIVTSDHRDQPEHCTLQVVDARTQAAVILEQWYPRAWHCADRSGVAWSPDGRQIAYERTHHIQVIDATGGPSRIVALGWGVGLSWWPGGKIAYTCGAKKWCAVGLDGANPVSLGRYFAAVTWSPQANRIAYFLDPPRPGGGWTLQVWTARPDGSNARMLVAQKAECCLTIMPTLAWSPDGTKLLATGGEAQVIDVRSGRVQKLKWYDSPHAWRKGAWQPTPGGTTAGQ